MAKTNLSLAQVNGQILSVSQFTLYGALKEGNRPSFIDALKPDDARLLYAYFNNLLREKMPISKPGSSKPI
jgi:D-tyrosyl-tRNA(Tyr) deacylase